MKNILIAILFLFAATCHGQSAANYLDITPDGVEVCFQNSSFRLNFSQQAFAEYDGMACAFPANVFIMPGSSVAWIGICGDDYLKITANGTVEVEISGEYRVFRL